MARKKKKSFESRYCLVDCSSRFRRWCWRLPQSRLPIIGPIVAKLMALKGRDPKLSDEHVWREMLDGHPKR